MTVAKGLIAEFEEQAPLTRRFLERLPEDKLTWKPHEKSMTAGQLALHIAQAPGSISRAIQQSSAQAPDFDRMLTQPATVQEILKAHDESVATVREELTKFDDSSMQQLWRVKRGERELFAWPRAKFVRDIMLSHLYQHRGQLSVYLRMLNVAVPSTWGPSADESPVFLQNNQAA
jgi:uncharacterized damage-inducible protein DinB